MLRAARQLHIGRSTAVFVFDRHRRGASQPAKSRLPVLRRSSLFPTRFPTHSVSDRASLATTDCWSLCCSNYSPTRNPFLSPVLATTNGCSHICTLATTDCCSLCDSNQSPNYSPFLSAVAATNGCSHISTLATTDCCSLCDSYHSPNRNPFLSAVTATNGCSHISTLSWSDSSAWRAYVCADYRRAVRVSNNQSDCCANSTTFSPTKF